MTVAPKPFCPKCNKPMYYATKLYSDGFRAKFREGWWCDCTTRNTCYQNKEAGIQLRWNE